MTVLAADDVLDCCGLLCPMPVVRLSAAIKRLAVGQVLKLICTDQGSPADMAAWAKLTRQHLLDWHTEGHRFVFYIERLR